MISNDALRSKRELKNFLINWIETYFDDIKKDPQEYEQSTKIIFSELGLEPSLDAVLCHIMGICMGSISVIADFSEFNRDDFTIEMMKFVYPKILELKEIMLHARLKR